jgi:hypothetical protein
MRCACPFALPDLINLLAAIRGSDRTVGGADLPPLILLSASPPRTRT